MQKLSYEEVQERFPKAWAAVPECYQNDSVIQFFLEDKEVDLSGQKLLWAISEDPACAFTALWIPGMGWLNDPKEN